MKYFVQVIFYAIVIGALVVINLNQLSLSRAEYQNPISAPISAPEVTPAPSQNNDNHDNGGSNGGGGNSGGGDNGPSVCGDQKPGTPVLLSVIKTGPNQVMLTWSKPVGPVTSYVLAYGLTPAKMLYGNPNVGNKNSYVVNNLQAKTAYYFQVRAANNCAPGAFSNTLGVSAYGKIINTKAATGFAPGTLSATKVKVAPKAAVVNNAPALSETPAQPEAPKMAPVNISKIVDSVFGKVLNFLYR